MGTLSTRIGPAATRGATIATLAIVLVLARAASAWGAATAAGPSNANATTDAATDTSFAPSTAPPWNPPHPAPRYEMWEHVLHVPGRIVTLPFSVLGLGLQAGLLKLEDKGVLHYGNSPSASKGSNGVIIGPASLGDRTGFGGRISLPPVPPAHWMRLDFSGSTLRYDATRLLLFKSVLGAELLQDWRPQEQFFGPGLQTRAADRTDYAVQRAEVRALLVWPPLHSITRRDTTIARNSRFENHGFTSEAWLGSRTTVIRRGHESGTPSFDTRFPAFADQRDARTDQLRWGALLRWDGRGGVPHHAHGTLFEAVADRLDSPIEALALTSGQTVATPSTRITLSGETNFSIMRDPRTLRLSGRISHLETGHGGGIVLLPDLARLGGDAGLPGYDVGRFTDRDLVLGAADYIFPLEAYAEFDVHAELGGVYPDVRHDAKLRTLKPSYGAYLRARGPGSVMGRIGVAFSPETTRLEFSLGASE